MKLRDMLFSVTYPVGDGGRVGDSFIGTRVECAKWALARNGKQIKVVKWGGYAERWPVLIESLCADSNHHTGATVSAPDEPGAKIAALELVASHLDLLHHDLTPNFLIAEAVGDHFCREVIEVLEDTFFDLADLQVHKEVFAFERPSSGVSQGVHEGSGHEGQRAGGTACGD